MQHKLQLALMTSKKGNENQNLFINDTWNM